MEENEKKIDQKDTKKKSLGEALAMPNADLVDFDPPKLKILIRPEAFL